MSEDLEPLLAAVRETLRDRRDIHLALLFGSRAHLSVLTAKLRDLAERINKRSRAR